MAVASALGATSQQVRGFVWSEATFVLLGGIEGGGALSFIVADMLVKILTQAFGPPPTGMTIPWTYLLVIGASIGATIVATGCISARQGARCVLEIIRRLQFRGRALIRRSGRLATFKPGRWSPE